MAASSTGTIVILPSGLIADNMAAIGLLGAVQNLDQAAGVTYTSVADSTATVTATAAAVVGGILNRTGSPGGAVTETTPTALLIIAALPTTISYNGTYQFKFRYINNALTQTVTWTAGTGVTVTGTATIATSTWRDFLVTVDSRSAVTFTNLGAGTL